MESSLISKRFIWLTAILTAGAVFTSCTVNSPERDTDNVNDEPGSGPAKIGETSETQIEPQAEAEAEADDEDSSREPDVVFVPTPQTAVEKMLEMADIKEGDLLYDLGCGDGRIVVTAAKKYGIEAVGVDIDPVRVEEARERVEEANVEDLVTIKEADLFEIDFSDADVVTLYLLPSLNQKLKPKLAQLEPGSRIVSYDFHMAGAKPEEVYESSDDEWSGTIYKWVVPWEEEETAP